MLSRRSGPATTKGKKKKKNPLYGKNQFHKRIGKKKKNRGRRKG